MEESNSNEPQAGGEKFTISRQELFDLTWSVQLETLAKQLGQSVNALQKTCINLSIPLPRPEYWGKSQQAKASEKPVLPLLPAGKKNEVELIRSASKARKVRIPPSASPPLPDLDPLLFAVQQTLTRKDNSSSDEIRRSAQGQLSISAAPANIERAIRFMNHFLYAFRARGYTIEIDESGTRAIIDGQEIFIQCYEKFRREVRHPGGYSEMKRSNILVFHMKCGFRQKEWTEENQLLEAQVTAILDTLARTAKKEKEEQIRNAEMRAKMDQRIRGENEIKQKKLSELANFKDLLQQATRWRQANMLRDYLASVEENALTSGSLTAEMKEWINWARGKVDWYDPLIEAADEWMTEVNRATLRFKTESSFEEQVLLTLKNLGRYGY